MKDKQTQDGENEPVEDANIARLLRVAGRREELPANVKTQWEVTFRTELQKSIHKGVRRKQRKVAGLCAGFVAAAALLFAVEVKENPTPDIASITAHSASGSYTLQFANGQSISTLQPGQAITVNSMLRTGDDGFLRLDYAGYDLRLNSNTELLLEHEKIELLSGELYASDEGLENTGAPLMIGTPYGTISDIGTQFSVQLQDNQLLTTVRRGIVTVNSDAHNLRAEAPSEGATQIRINSSGVSQHSVEPSGAQWEWIYTGTSQFSLEGKSAKQFLEWSVLESGLRLVFANRSTEIYSESVLLHGDIGNLDPEQAVTPVLSTTDLTASRIDNTLFVALKNR